VARAKECVQVGEEREHPVFAIVDNSADSGARRTGFRGERENDSGVKANRIPG
jgi:hypothetical protein